MRHLILTDAKTAFHYCEQPTPYKLTTTIGILTRLPSLKPMS